MWFAVPVVLAAALAAAGDSTTIDPITALNYGVFGVLVVLLVTGRWVVTRRELDTANGIAAALTKERDAAQAEVREKNQLIQDKYVPSLEAARVAQESMLAFLRDAGKREA